MKKGGGKNKGGCNERKKAKDLSLWWTKGERDDIFFRTSSGARATSRAKKGKTTANEYGDIIALDPIGEPLLRLLTIETKKGYNKELDALSLIDSNGKQLIREFWNKACDDSIRAGLAGWGYQPALILHRDRRQPIIIITKTLHDVISRKYGRLPYTETLWWDGECGTLVFMRLEVFFKWAPPEFFSEWYFGPKNEN